MLGCGLVPMSPGGLHSQGPDEGPARDDQVVATTKAVLLVEDEPAIALSLGDALREEGLAVATAQNGLEALQLLRNGLRHGQRHVQHRLCGRDGPGLPVPVELWRQLRRRTAPVALSEREVSVTAPTAVRPRATPGCLPGR